MGLDAVQKSGNKRDSIDLKPQHLRLVKQLLATYLPSVKVWAFGSRVTFKSRIGSDLDIVAFASKNQEQAVSNLREAFDESDLPFSVDVLVWDEVPERFHDNILRDYFIIQDIISSKMTLKWNVVRLEQIANIHTGKTNRQDAIEDGIFPLFDRSSTIRRSNKYLFDDSAVIVPGEGREFIPRYYSGKFDLHQRAYCITVKDKDVVDIKYLYYYLLCKRTYWERVAVGSTVKSLRLNSFTDFSISLPAIQEQKTIAHILSTLDDKIELNSKMNQTLEDMAKALFKSWFVNFDPVHAKAAGKAPAHMDADTAALFPSSFGDDGLPVGWRNTTVGKLVEPRRGKTITRSQTTEGIFPVVTGGLEPAYFHSQFNVGYPVITISASGANAGFTRLYNEKIWASDCSYISLKQTKTPYFWYVYLKTFQQQIYHMRQGAAQPHIYPSDLMRLELCIPSDKTLINHFEQLCESYFNRVAIAQQESKAIRELRDTLLPKLISGELKINATTRD